MEDNIIYSAGVRGSLEGMEQYNQSFSWNVEGETGSRESI